MVKKHDSKNDFDTMISKKWHWIFFKLPTFTDDIYSGEK